MAKVTVNEDLCKGCGLCVNACPQHIMKIADGKINRKGHNPAQQTDSTKCTGCAFCALMCPDCVITVER